MERFRSPSSGACEVHARFGHVGDPLSGFDTITIRDGHGEEVLELIEFERRVEAGEVDLLTEVRFLPLTGNAFVRVGEIEAFRRLMPPSGIYFQRAFHLGRVPFLTLLVCGINLAIFYLQQKSGPVHAGVLIAFGAKAGPLIDDLGEFWRLITANFVHFDTFHIGLNLFVIFHFGAAVENAFRPWDFLAILLASALGTTLASYSVTGAITMGASGIAYGFLGSAVVFGIKYRKFLPRRHRAVLGAAAIPTVLIFLYMGLTSEGIDNWGHFGGLAAGAATTLPLQPRLYPSRSRRSLLLGRVLPITGIVLGIWGGSHLLESHLPRMVRIERPDLGLAFSVPRGWNPRAPGIYDNALPLHARASVAIALREPAASTKEGAPDLLEEARHWSEEELVSKMANGLIRQREAGPILLGEIGGMSAASRRLELVVDSVPTVLTASFASNGDKLYSLVVTRPVGLPAYDRVLQRILESVEVQ